MKARLGKIQKGKPSYWHHSFFLFFKKNRADFPTYQIQLLLMPVMVEIGFSTLLKRTESLIKYSIIIWDTTFILFIPPSLNFLLVMNRLTIKRT